MKIILAADHGGFELNQKIKGYLTQQKLDYIDVGAQVFEPLDDFPQFIEKGVKQMKTQKDCVGIFTCGSGIGVCIAANRNKGIRAALCHSVEYARLARLHNNANVLCLGGRFTSFEEVKKIIDTFLTTEFLDGKYQIRMEQVDAFKQ